MKYVNFDIVFQEVPDETTLAINISNCPCFCEGCHSSYLSQDIGQSLDKETLPGLLNKYCNAITCVAFMGGDASVKEVEALAQWTKSNYKLKVAWYSGRDEINKQVDFSHFDYVKIGAYRQEYGDLTKKTTNQKMFRIHHLPDKIDFEDITKKFWK